MSGNAILQTSSAYATTAASAKSSWPSLHTFIEPTFRSWSAESLTSRSKAPSVMPAHSMRISRNFLIDRHDRQPRELHVISNVCAPHGKACMWLLLLTWTTEKRGPPQFPRLGRDAGDTTCLKRSSPATGESRFPSLFAERCPWVLEPKLTSHA